MQTLNKKLLEDYLREIEGFTYQQVDSFGIINSEPYINILYNYTDINQKQFNEIITISLFDLISFVYSKI